MIGAYKKKVIFYEKSRIRVRKKMGFFTEI